MGVCCAAEGPPEIPDRGDVLATITALTVTAPAPSRVWTHPKIWSIAVTTKIDLPFTAEDLARLRASCTGVVATASDDAYAAEVSTWNLAVELRPLVAIGATNTADVAHAVRWAAELGLAVGVNTTGHGAVPNADGALLINTRRMTDVRIDVTSATATVSAGARLRDVTAAAAPHGLACVQGSSGSAGAVGFTLGGGLGVMSRTFGLAADRVLSIDVVTADGRSRTVDTDHHPDLFWALRGGKGNFGVVTSYRIALERLTTFYGGGLFFDGADARAVWHGYRQWIAEHTEATSSSVALLHLPPDPHLPAPIRGRRVAHVRLAHVGDHREGARLARRMRTFAPVVLDTLGELPITALDLVHLDPPNPTPAHERGCLLDELSDDTIDAILRHVTAEDTPLVLVEVRHLGGAIARPPAIPSAVPGRAAPFLMFAIAPHVPALADISPRAVAGLLDAVRPWRHPETLPNFLGRSFRPDDVTAAWSPRTLDHLLDIKHGWDLVNVFRVGHALLPAPAETGR
jgi:FAD binding domain